MAEEQQERGKNVEEEDWRVFEVLCGEQEMEVPDVDVDVTTSLRSDLAALQFKKERLTEELNDMKCQFRSREQRCLELQLEADQLREQSARQTAIISSLRKRLSDIEERERNMHVSQGRHEIAMQTLQRDNKYREDQIKDLERKLRNMETDLSAEEEKKVLARNALQDVVRKLGIALGEDVTDTTRVSVDLLMSKASEMIQETSRLRNRALNCNENLAATEYDLKTTKETLDRITLDRESLQRQTASQLIEIDKLRQEKDALEMRHRVMERDTLELKEKYASSSRNLNSASSSVAQLESTVCQLRDELKIREEKCHHLQHDFRQCLESMSVMLSTPGRFVESSEESIKNVIREILAENKDRIVQLEALKEKFSHESSQLTRNISMLEQANAKCRASEEDKSHLELKLHKIDAELNECEMSRENLKRDKATLVNFLDRLARVLNVEDTPHDVSLDIQTESLLMRAEQLSRLESDKLVDKTSMVYQLQRRLRTLREQLQRKELHLDLLRRKLSLQEDNAKTKCLLQNERDEATSRVKRLMKQLERMQLQLNEAKTQVRDSNAQLAEAADYKISALERARKIDELQKRLVESEALRVKCNRKVAVLKEQVRATGDTVEQERHMSEHSLQLLREELSRMKDALSETDRRDSQLQNFRCSVAKILGCVLPMPDYELVSRLQKLVDAHHDFTVVSRRYDDPVLRLTSRSPTGGSRCTRTPDRCRYDDSGYVDAGDVDDIDDDTFKRRHL